LYLNPLPMDPVNALLGFVVSSLGQAVLSGATQAILGTRVERSLKSAFSSAIDVAADEFTSSTSSLTQPGASGRHSSELRDALRKPSLELAQPERFADLTELVSAWLNAVYDGTPPDWLVTLGADGRLRLEESLHAQICREVIADALKGGALQPLAEHVNFERAFGLSKEILQQLRPLREMLEELLLLQRQAAERNDQPDPTAAATRTLIDDRTATFTGREYLCRKVDEVIGAPDFRSGYLLIVGEPGIGKTSLLAYLVSERNYIYHFNNRRQGITSAQEFLDSVSRQLASRYGLESALPASSPATSAVFSELLRQAAGKIGPEAPLIIAVDALDEADPANNGANRLLLPPVLPSNVYFLVTSRPLVGYQLSVDQRRTITIAEDDPQNLRDIRSYIARELDGPYRGDFSERIGAWGITRDGFIDTLTKKSQGNFMYTVHMLAGIRLNRLSEEAIDDITQLPDGLVGYYHMHWEVMKKRWQPALWEKHENAVRCLALMRNPVSPIMLIEMAGQRNLPGVDESLVLRVFYDWREFLDEEWNREYREKRYYIYHETFREFLEREGPSLEPMAQAINQNQISLLRQLIDGS
jgi:AAA ATPase domain